MQMTLFEAKEIQTFNSRIIAKETGKRHDHLIRDIEVYEGHMSQNPNLGATDFFIESSYIATNGKRNKCYEITRKGCEFIANKMTGVKGTHFTAWFINKFHAMEQDLQQSLAIKTGIELDAMHVHEDTIIIHKHDDYGQLLVVDINGEKWLKTIDVVRAMGYRGNPANVFKDRWKNLPFDTKIYRLQTTSGVQTFKLVNRELFEELVDGFSPHLTERRERARGVISWVLRDVLPRTPQIAIKHQPTLPTPVNHVNLEKDVALAERINELITPEMSDEQRSLLQSTVVSLIAKEAV